MADVPLLKLDTGASDGQVPTADGVGGYAWETPTGGAAGITLLDKATKTANQAGVTAETDVTVLTVTVAVAAGRRVRIETHMRLNVIQSSGSLVTTRGIARVYRGATQVGIALDAGGPASSSARIWHAGAGLNFDEPGAGTFTYKVTVAAVGTGASVDVEASATSPCHIAVYDDGPV